ncbi:MAG TPA: septal ring lytic transglycosylase RlpA family protein [Solirubrobacterales bacterium]|nr:septal ring lytic transglycosylase RlpA family protein [Solirubrobacterales bacterium]
MRRFRHRRRLAIAVAMASVSALTTTMLTTAFAAPETSARKAQIDASSRTVAVGKPVTLRGTFPDAANARVEIRHRAAGSKRWVNAGHTTTGASGRYATRVSPRRSGYWRAELATPSVRTAQASTEGARIDSGTGSERIAVRSRTRATVHGRHATAGRTVRVEGKVTPAGIRRKVVVQIGGREETTRAGRDGRFSVTWNARSTGTYPVRVKARSNRIAKGSGDRAGRVTVYRPAAASWYGPGLYGNTMACGGTLTPSTLGVAHKSMPCGTKLTLRYGGRSVNVRVVDRGPFAGNREFDLTSATKQRLGFPDVGTVLTSR